MCAFTSKSHCDHHPIRQTNDRPPPLPHPHYLGHAKRKPRSSESMVIKNSFWWAEYYNVTNVNEIHHRVLTSFSFKNPSLFSSKSVSNLSFSPSRNSWRKITYYFTKCLASKYHKTWMCYIYFCVYLILIFRTLSNKFLEVQLSVLVFVSWLHYWLNDCCTHDVWMIFRMGKRNILFSIQFSVTIDISSLSLKTSHYWLLIILF